MFCQPSTFQGQSPLQSWRHILPAAIVVGEARGMATIELVLLFVILTNPAVFIIGLLVIHRDPGFFVRTLSQRHLSSTMGQEGPITRPA